MSRTASSNLEMDLLMSSSNGLAVFNQKLIQKKILPKCLTFVFNHMRLVVKDTWHGRESSTELDGRPIIIRTAEVDRKACNHIRIISTAILRAEYGPHFFSVLLIPGFLFCSSLLNQAEYRRKQLQSRTRGQL
jgi:hypothetical protein